MKQWFYTYFMLLSFVIKGFVYLGLSISPILVIVYLPSPYGILLGFVTTVLVLPILIMGPEKFVGDV